MSPEIFAGAFYIIKKSSVVEEVGDPPPFHFH